MLIIRSEQQNLLADENFKRRLFNFFKADFQLFSDAYTDEDITRLISDALVSGRAINIKTERELSKWALMGIITHGICYTDKTIHFALERAGAYGKKVDLLLDIVT